MHDFVDTKLANTLGILPIGKDGIKVQIAYGRETDLFILLLASCDVILGIQWLRTLGPILCVSFCVGCILLDKITSM
jgi:hypothetical protein